MRREDPEWKSAEQDSYRFGAGEWGPWIKWGLRCFLLFALLLTALTWYYFKYFQIRVLEDPTAGLSYVKVDDATQLNDFRKQTVKQICLPLKQELGKLKNLRKASLKGSVKPEDFNQDLKEVQDRLKEIRNEATLRRIPKQYERQYHVLLSAVGGAKQSANLLEMTFEQESVVERDMMYIDSIRSSKEASRQVENAQEFFAKAYKLLEEAPGPKKDLLRSGPVRLRNSGKNAIHSKFCGFIHTHCG